MFNWMKTAILMAGIMALFSTHPPIEQRIAALQGRGAA